MTARDDYPLIGKFWKDNAVHRQAHDALNEIDRLRAENAQLRSSQRRYLSTQDNADSLLRGSS